MDWIKLFPFQINQYIFINLKTGEFTLDQPVEASNILNINEKSNYWWEIFQSKTSRFYYYNDQTEKTVWQKPKDKDAIIIPIWRLQIIESNISQKNCAKTSLNGEVILKKDGSTQTDITTTTIYHNVATQTIDKEILNFENSFNCSAYINQFENLSNKSNVSKPNCKKINCHSLRHYLVSEAKCAGVYNGDYWNQNISDEENLNQFMNKNSKVNQKKVLNSILINNSGDSSSYQWDADDEDADSDSILMNQDNYEEEEEEENEENEDEDYDDDEYEDDDENDDVDEFDLLSTDDDKVNYLYTNSSKSFLQNKVDEIENYFENDIENNFDPEMRLKRFSDQIEKKSKLLNKNGKLIRQKFLNSNEQEDDCQIEKDEDEYENEHMKKFSEGKENIDNDYLETTSFIFFNKAASLSPTASTPILNRNLIQEDEVDLPEHVATRINCSNQSKNLQKSKSNFSVTNESNSIRILPNATAFLDKAQVIDQACKTENVTVHLVDLLNKQLPNKPKKENKKCKKLNDQVKETEKKPKPPKRGNSLDSSLNKKNNSTKKNKTQIKNEELEKFAKENIKRHLKKGGLNQVFKRRESLKDMLVWTKSAIKQPMSASLLNNSELKQEAIDCFRLIQIYCGDREMKLNESLNFKTSTLDSNSSSSFSLTNSFSTLGKETLIKEDIAFKLIERAVLRNTQMKDEIFIQLCRQTTGNPNEESLHNGLMLMTICFYYFTASQKFVPYLYSFLTNHKYPFAQNVCLPKFEKKINIASGMTNSNSYCKRPLNAAEIKMVTKTIEKRIPGIFGESLTELMKVQSKRWPNRKLPWILVTLSETILRLNGNEQEGIFRIAGDVEEMNFIKLYLDCFDYEKYIDNCDFIDILNSWKCCAMNRTNKDEIGPVDVNAIACVLKQWFRELPEPLIAYDLYNEALDSCDNPSKAVEIVENKMNEINKQIIGYLIRFLQVFSAKQNVELTKMDESNLSMVWAPNLLRQRKANLPTDPSEIFNNTRREMTFIRTLIQSLDTNYIQGII